ncbi:putative ammonium transporter 3 [Amphiura filiformis]|uniref:putative ammonium transporter 3 n=1 Tax=Amphiura filiformis TaxID=82378 RepID=UPI003B226EA0
MPNVDTYFETKQKQWNQIFNELPADFAHMDNIIIEDVYVESRWDDETWILTSAFIIFTMQSGFGLLESGSVSRKNEVNIMVKNAVDVLFAGIAYWIFGYGLSFGTDEGSTRFYGMGHFFVDSTDPELSVDHTGDLFGHFFFHASFATTASTIVSGAMAERTKLDTYICLSFVTTAASSIPAHWMWSEEGWLKQLGAVDIAGASAVHLVGGVTGLVATLILGPRIGRFEMHRSDDESTKMGSPTNMIFGTFMLW